MISDPVLLAYLEESLAGEVMATIENELRRDPNLRERLSALIAQRENGIHSVGDIWRRNRISCPTREELGSYLLGAMMEDASAYIQFHIEQIGCRYCLANLEDLQSAEGASTSHAAVRQRRDRFFQSSVGRVRKFPER
jgi:hypothetical protein